MHFEMDYPKVPSAGCSNGLAPGTVSRLQLQYDTERQNAIFGFALADGSQAQTWHEQYVENNRIPDSDIEVPLKWTEAVYGPVPEDPAGAVTGHRPLIAAAVNKTTFEAANPKPTWMTTMLDKFLERHVSATEVQDVVVKLEQLQQGGKAFSTLVAQYEGLMSQLPKPREEIVRRDALLGKMNPDLGRLLRSRIDTADPDLKYDVMVRMAISLDDGLYQQKQERRQASAKKDSAKTGNGNRNNNKTTNHSSSSSSSSGRNNNNNSSKRKARSDDFCEHCKKDGHLEEQCWNKDKSKRPGAKYSAAQKARTGNGNNNNNDNKKRRANNNVECEDATGSVSNVARVYSKTETRKVAKEYLQNATGSNQTVLVPRAVAQTTATDKLDDDVIMTATAEASTKTPTWSVTRGTQTEDPNTVALKNAYHQKKMEDQHTATMTPAQLDEAFLSDAEFERLCAVDELDERCNRILFGAEDDLGLGVSTPKE